MVIIRALQRILNAERSAADEAIVNALKQIQKAISHLHEMDDVCVGGDSVPELIKALEGVESKIIDIKAKFNDDCFGHNFGIKASTYPEALNIVKQKIEERLDDVTKNPDLIRPFTNIDDDIPF